LDLSGHIEPVLFEKAWNAVIAGNEMLRTAFRWEKLDAPIRIVLKEQKLQPDYYDLSGLSDDDAQNAQAEIEKKDWANTFHLRTTPFRITLSKIKKNRCRMIISNHHILYDGWSNGIILKEFFNAYALLAVDKKVEPPRKSKFKEFVKWLRERNIEKEEEFWKECLRGFDTPTELSIKGKASGPETAITRTGKYRFEDSLTVETDRFAGQHKITPASLLLGTLGLLLQRYNNTGDVIFGTTVSGRNAAVKGIEDIVGLFINTIPLRVKTHRDQEKLELIRQVDELLRQRQEHDCTSLVKIKEYSELDGNEELFDTIAVIENYPLDKRLAQKESQLSVDSYSMTELTHYDLTVAITLFEGIELDITYDGRLFKKESIEQFAGHYKNILKDIVAFPLQPVSAIKMMSEQEMAQVLVEFNDTAGGYPNDKTLRELFREQVERTPDGEALVWAAGAGYSESGPLSLTYRKLSARANRLAHRMRAGGIRPGAVTGFILGRSVEMIVAILAILEAGGTYLPMDPKAPSARKKYMLEDSNAKLLLTHRGLGEEIETVPQIPRIELDSFSREGPDPGTLPYTGDSDDLAYIIYTSG
ncbi:MAG: AMP-binding protein, partial [bacterium]|nr:AMP-binding protein [bacterium]